MKYTVRNKRTVNSNKPKRDNNISKMNNDLQHRRFLTKMDDLNHTKARARAAGYAGNGPVCYPSYLRNGQIVEIAMCHLLGAMQRRLDYRFSIYMSKELDMEGIDMKIVTPYGTKNVQMKHTSVLKGRKVNPGEYLVPVEAGGYRIIYNFFSYYRLPMPSYDKYEHVVMIKELEYIFAAYTKGMYEF